MMNAVWVMIILSFNGHGQMTPLPVLEFKSQEKCIEAMKTIVYRFPDTMRNEKPKFTCIEIQK